MIERKEESSIGLEYTKAILEIPFEDFGLLTRNTRLFPAVGVNGQKNVRAFPPKDVVKIYVAWKILQEQVSELSLPEKSKIAEFPPLGSDYRFYWNVDSIEAQEIFARAKVMGISLPQLNPSANCFK